MMIITSMMCIPWYTHITSFTGVGAIWRPPSRVSAIDQAVPVFAVADGALQGVRWKCQASPDDPRRPIGSDTLWQNAQKKTIRTSPVGMGKFFTNSMTIFQ